jgi:hypothetical protein
MKLRIHGNSLRVRISEIDREALRRDGRVEYWMGVGPERRFVSALEANSEIDQLGAEFDHDALTVTMPRAWVDSWTDVVGYESMQPIDGDQQLHVLVEMDVGCRHGRPQSVDASGQAEES